MVRDMETFYPRKDEMGNGPIELVLGNVLDKVSMRHSAYSCTLFVREASMCAAAAPTNKIKKKVLPILSLVLDCKYLKCCVLRPWGAVRPGQRPAWVEH